MNNERIDINKAIIKNMMTTIDIVEHHLRMRFRLKEKTGSEPKLTETEITYFFTKTREKLKDMLIQTQLTSLLK